MAENEWIRDGNMYTYTYYIHIKMFKIHSKKKPHTNIVANGKWIMFHGEYEYGNIQKKKQY